MSNASLRNTTNLLACIPKRYASSASAQKSTSEHHQLLLKNEGIRVTKLKNGVVVASLENYSPVSRISAVVNVGARNESFDLQGAAHGLRVFSSLATKNYTSFGITRTLDHLGANFSVTSTREQTLYNLEVSRNNLDKVSGLLIEIIGLPKLRHWEVNDTLKQIELDLEYYKQSPELRLSDHLHRAAFRNGLQRSLYAPCHFAHSLSADKIIEFRENNFSSDKLSLIGIGVKHENLVRFGEKFHFEKTSSKPELSKYLGTEVREENLSDIVHVAIATEGASLSGKDLLASGIVNHAFGAGSNLKWSNGASRITRSTLALASEPAAISSFNLNYSDTGLFGFNIVANQEDAGKLLRGVFKESSKVAKSGFTNEEIAQAKYKLKASISISLESAENQIKSLALSPENAAYSNINEISKAIDAVSAADVNAFAKRVTSGKASLAAIGNLKNLPRLDELSA